jgi:hypothetical protein
MSHFFNRINRVLVFKVIPGEILNFLMNNTLDFPNVFYIFSVLIISREESAPKLQGHFGTRGGEQKTEREGG